MSRVRVACLAVSVDGYCAGPAQSLDNPLGIGGLALHEWAFATQTFQQMHGGGEGGDTGVDDDFMQRSFENVGAWILGRNMFGPIRGPWPDDAWKGWWGDTPPYHTDVFVLTHHARPAIEMDGGTTFHFVTDGIDRALDRAKSAARDRDVRIGGGAQTIRQYLQAGLIDELHLVVAPVLLGAGESLLSGLNLVSLGYRCVDHARSEMATHVVLAKS